MKVDFKLTFRVTIDEAFLKMLISILSLFKYFQ